MKKFSITHGFTLIELLVVIAVIGVLAAGVFTAINPLKRIQQANDAKIKNDIGQIAQAEQAYFTTNQSYTVLVADLVTSKDLKVEPKIPPAGNVPYTIVKSPGSCTTAAKDCTEIAIYGALNDPLVAANVWCWRSSSGVAAETTVALCTAP